MKHARKRIAYVLQRTSVDWDFLPPPRTWWRWVFTAKLAGAVRSAPSPRVAREHLDRVGMADFASRQIGQLSGGQQQRVFLARALAQRQILPDGRAVRRR